VGANLIAVLIVAFVALRVGQHFFVIAKNGGK